jgi:lysophospholipid acyltransferase (LPLAT)-like uncharacterized protein
VSAATSADARHAGFRERALGAAVAGMIRVLGATVRLRFHDAGQIRAREREGRRFVLAFWHRHLLLMRYAYRGDRMTVMVSRSRDGELIAQAMSRLGVHSVRASSSKGAAAGLKEVIRVARDGSDIAFTPDGPRGPARQVQPGVVFAAAVSGLPVIPVAIEASRAWEARSWDRMLVPKPGARVEIVYGDPLEVPRDADLADWGERLRNALDGAEARAAELAGRVRR